MEKEIKKLPEEEESIPWHTASIFRKENILEYKSPYDYVSVGDFYKVYGYACVYIALNKVDVKDMTLTFVENHYPRELLAHLREARGYTVEEKLPGIYIVKGDILPIQIIDSRKLSSGENIWLKDLDKKLDLPELRRIAEEVKGLGKEKAARIEAYLYVIRKANLKRLREAGKMNVSEFDYETLKEAWDELLVETGDAARWEARGEARGREESTLEIARKMKEMGFLAEQIQAVTGLPAESRN